MLHRRYPECDSRGQGGAGKNVEGVKDKPRRLGDQARSDRRKRKLQCDCLWYRKDMEGPMKTPRVSICVPNLNTFPFLQERFDTIFAQTLRDWELFVYDSLSDDGSWEFIQGLAKQEKRMRIAQGPREGCYPAWNRCLHQTNAEYVYIATSDDTMAPDCLEKLVTALDQHEDCELAHCPLVLVDVAGRRVTDQSWPECTVFGDGIGELVNRPHVRRAPYDGLLQLTGRHTFLSITELLIRRSLFSRTGYFTDRWGSVSDFNWEMRAGLIANTVHVPDTWATWRVHSKGISASIDYTADHYRKFEEMVEDAISACEAYLAPEIAAGLNSGLLDKARRMRTYYAELRQRRKPIDRRLFQLSQLLTGSVPVRSEVIGRLLGGPKWPEIAPAKIRRWLEASGLHPLVPC